MEVSVVLNELPIELLRVIASHDVKVYRGIALTCKGFSSSLTPSMLVDYKLAFGYSVIVYNGHTYWLLNRLNHRTDGPAIEWENGDKEWYIHGLRHREGGPAVERNGTEWWNNGERHRSGGLPAFERNTGSKFWYVNGRYHRDGGLPAVEEANGTKMWWVNGVLHREYGPAIEHSNGTKEWWTNGKCTYPNTLVVKFR